MDIYAYFAVFAASPAPTHPSIKEAAFGRLHKGGQPSAASLCGFLYGWVPGGWGGTK